MIVVGILLYLVCGPALTSGSIYGDEVYAGEKWWSRSFFVKFYSPSGKNYFIDYQNGEIALEGLESMQDSTTNNMTSPYISFVAVNLKVYDIFFDHIPHIVEKQVDYEDKTTFIRHSLHSFTGPNKQIYTLTYDNISNVYIEAEKPENTLEHLEIKTLGPYSKWEHTYTFSQNGDTATDLSLSPVKITTDRSILLPEMDRDLLKDRSVFLANFNTPSLIRYIITNELNIAKDEDKPERTDQPYITFVEPNDRVYEICFEKDGSEYVVKIVARDNVNEDTYNYGQQTVQLSSFVGPDKKSYQIDRKNEDLPVLDSTPITSSDFRITFVVTSKYYKRFVSFIFSNDGKTLYDRVEEFDSTALSDKPGLTADEVEVDGDIAKSSFLTFYSPSGRIYYLTPDDNKAKFAVANARNKNLNSPYISFGLEDGRMGNIYYGSTGTTEIEFSPTDGINSSNSFSILSFVTPDKELHKMSSYMENGIKIPYIDITAQPRDPLDKKPQDGLRIVIASKAREFDYLFTWNGDKLINAFSKPLKRVSSNVLKSLIGR